MGYIFCLLIILGCSALTAICTMILNAVEKKQSWYREMVLDEDRFDMR